MLRRLAALLPQPVVAWLNDLQHRHRRLGLIIAAIGGRVASAGEGTIRRGPGAGLRIDATGTNPGYLLGTADHQEQMWLADHLKPGQTFYDIGANIGFFTLVGAKLVGARGAVVAFEPLPENVRQLERNVAINQLGNVRVVAAAVADIDSNGRMFWLGADAEARNTGRLLAKEVTAATIQVPVTTIDAELRRSGLPPPSLIKVDVEGDEIEVLRGSLQTLRDYRPTLLVEVHWLEKAFADFVEAELAPLGYRAATISGAALPAGRKRFHASLIAR